MIRSLTGLSAILACAAAAALFHVKYRVVELERQYAQIRWTSTKARERMQLLKAELTYLRNPQRLQSWADVLGIIPATSENISALHPQTPVMISHEDTESLEALIAETLAQDRQEER